MPRVVFLGMGGAFSLEPFRALVEAGLDVAALVIPGRTFGDVRPPSTVRRALRLVPSDAAHVAFDHGIPVLTAGSLAEAAALARLDELEPDVVVVACFPRRLPAAWRERPRLGALNLHPSLLPAYRGPAPLFWQFRAGEERTGVTLHRVDDGFDTGAIVAQSPVAFPEGIDTDAAERLIAGAGARLLLEALRGDAIVSHPQEETGASVQGAPTAADRRLTTEWDARLAYNFIRGARAWGPFLLQAGDRRLNVRDALAREPADGLGPRLRRAQGGWRVRFQGGVVLVDGVAD